MSPWKSLSIQAHRRPGFTLVELLVVVLIIGILAAIALPRLLGQRTRAKNAAAQVAVRHALVAVRSWYASDGRESYAGLCSDAANARGENRCSGKTALSSLESSLGTAEPADSQRPGSGANPQDIWMGNGTDGTDPAGSTVTLCSASRGDTVYCIKDTDGAASYYAFQNTGVSAGAGAGQYSASGWDNPGTASSSGFAFRKKLFIKTGSGGAGLSGSLSNFPIAVVVNSYSWPTQSERDSFFSGNNNVAGKRVQFRAADETTVLPYEVESFSASSEAVYWVKVPSLSVSDSSNYIWLYYGSDPGSSTDQKTSVWDSNFVGTWHLSGGRGDSTSNTNDLNQSGTETYAAGRTGQALDLPGNSTGLTYLATDVNPELRTTGQFTYEMWTNADSFTSTIYDPAVVFNEGRAAESVGAGVLLRFARGSGVFYFTEGDASGSWASWAISTTQQNTGTTYFNAAVYDGSYGRAYVNGAQEGTANLGAKTWSWGTTGYPNPATLYLSGYHTNSGTGNTDTGAMTAWFDGRIEEVRISNTARSADWIRATYFSMKKTSWVGDSWLSWDAAQSG